MENLRIAVIKARWHAEIVDQAVGGLNEELADQGRLATVTCYDVPGAFEMPLLAKKLGQSGKFDAIVAAAFVVDGGIYRHDFVAQAVVTGLMDAQMATGIPTFSVSLTPHHFQPTNEHLSFFRDHFVTKGREAASAVLAMADLSLLSRCP